MKRTLIAGLITVVGLLACSTWAADAEAGKGLTAEQQQQRSELIAKYDVNKDGVLDKPEMKKLSRSDKRALAKLGGVGTAKKSAPTDAASKGKGEEKSAEAKPAEGAGKPESKESKGKSAEKAPKEKGKK